MRYLIPAILLLSACAPRRPLPPPAPPSRVVQAEPAPLPKNMPRPDLVLVPGDLIRIAVFQQPDLELETRIPDTGSISYPLIGSVQAAGKNSATLEQTIRQKLAEDFLQSPSVTVTVREYAKRRVFIVGGVVKPDGYEMSHESRLTVLQLVAAAGGFTERASKDIVQVVRRAPGGERSVLRFSLAEVEKQLAAGKPEADLDLWPDDLVVVPAAVRMAYVLGQVHRPGSIDLPHNTKVTVSMAVAHAGSYTKFAACGEVQILRHGPTGARTLIVDLDAVLGGRVDLDVEILPGDVVWVPERGLF